MLKQLSGLAALVFLAGFANAATAAGTAVGVDPDAEARGGETRTLVVGSDVFIGDRIVTNARGLVQILFDDKTRLVVGPRSSLVIEDYLIRNDGSAGRLAVNALGGTFRFISGNSPKNRYLIQTPTGQIGVRGTAFDLFVGQVTHVLQLQGTTINCSSNGDCQTMSRRCEVAVIERGGVQELGSSRDFSRAELEDAMARFRFAVSQSSLIRQFRVSNAEQCMRGSGRSRDDDDDGPRVRLELNVPESLGDTDVFRFGDDDDNDSYFDFD